MSKPSVRSDVLGQKSVIPLTDETGLSPLQSSAFEAKGASPLEWLLAPKRAPLFRGVELQSDPQAAERILARLVQIEAHEVDPHLRTDYRIAWLTVRYCQTNEAVECSPFVLATYRILHCHPDQVWPNIVAHRQNMLGPAVPIAPARIVKKSQSAAAEKNTSREGAA